MWQGEGLVLRINAGGHALGRALSIAGLSFLVLALATAAGAETIAAPAAKPLNTSTLEFQKRKSIAAAAPVYIRIFKEESELEIWKARADGRYVHIKTFPICNWSGGLGPKQSIGDHMAPEGFYALTKESLKADSSYHLALNIGYPNVLDKALGRTGDFIMVHGKCQSVGCYAMGDEGIEEVYAFVREALAAGQDTVPLHIFPFHMNDGNMALHLGHAAAESWPPLKAAFDDFEAAREPPRTAACSKHYVVNPVWAAGSSEPTDPAAECPAFMRRSPTPLSRKVAKSLGGEPLNAPGQKTRTAHDIAYWDDAAAKAEYAALKKREADRKARKASEAQRMTETGGIKPMMNP
jgi:murein L,D-transpeptidase YafK